MSGEAQGKLTSGGVSNDDELLQVKAVLPGVLSQELVGAANIGKRVGPPPTWIADAAIFHVGRSQAVGRESTAKVACVIQVVLGPPEASVDVDNRGMWA